MLKNGEELTGFGIEAEAGGEKGWGWIHLVGKERKESCGI